MPNKQTNKQTKPLANNLLRILAAFIFLLITSESRAELKNGMAADVVIGQPDFTSNTANNGGRGANTLNDPRALFSDGKRLFVVDRLNHRVLIWNSIPTSNFKSADVVVGQPNFTSATANNGGRGANTLSNPRGVFSDGRRLFIADRNNARVLIYNNIPTTNFASADVVIGQSTFTTANIGTTQNTFASPVGVAYDGKRVFVVDENNNRVLIWNSIPTSNGAPADVVVGQADFTSSTAATTRSNLRNSNGVYSDGKKLYVADDANRRVLIWNSIPTSNGMPADVVVGQPDFTSLNQTTSQTAMQETDTVFSDGKKLFVSEATSNRVMIFNTIPVLNNAAADVVIGQTDFTSTSTTPVITSTLSGPRGVFSDGKHLFIGDATNNRVLIYNIGSSSIGKEDPQFDQGKAVLGKVFNDVNGNGIQDEAESGLEGVKIASDTGIYAITDSDGKYHFPYIEVGQHLLKIDESTLPEGATITTDNPYKVTVTEGILTKVSFGVKLPAERNNAITLKHNNPITQERNNAITQQRNNELLLKVSVSQDPAMLKPKLAISHKFIRNNAITQERNNESIEFTIQCNYHLFIAKSRISLYDSSHNLIKSIDLPNPIPSKYTLPLNAITLKPNNATTLYYQLSVYDKDGKEDRTGVGEIEIR